MKRSISKARRAKAWRDGQRVRFELVVRPGAISKPEEHFRGIVSFPALVAELRATARRVALEAHALGDAAEGTTLTISGQVPRRTDAGGTAWDAIHLCQMMFSKGQWWQSTNGQRWTPIGGRS